MRGRPRISMMAIESPGTLRGYWMDDDEDVPENEYEAVTCQACARLHLVNRKTGKLLGQEEE